MPRPSPVWLDEQYNNRARITEHPEILKHWYDESVRARELHPELVERAYGTEPAERLDVFPARRAGAPVLVYIHGGYWRALDKRDQSFIAPPFIDAGAMVVLPGYALCPTVSVEHIVLQMVQALAWVYRNAAKFGGDPRRIVVAGHSAGGHLATMLLACDWRAVANDLPSDLVKAALSISGLYDLEPLRRTPFLAADLKLTRASARHLSPALFPPPLGTLVSVVGNDESEEFLRQADLIRKAWRSRCVIASERVNRRHHMNVLHELVEHRSRTHEWCLRLLGLRA